MNWTNYKELHLFECPTCCRKVDCPFNEVNALLFKGKVNWINGLSPEIITAIFLHHKTCVNAKE